MDPSALSECSTALRGLALTEPLPRDDSPALARVLVPAGSTVKVCGAAHLVSDDAALRAFAPWATVAGPATAADVLAAVQGRGGRQAIAALHRRALRVRRRGRAARPRAAGGRGGGRAGG
jgi:hypothetical protein